MHSELSKQLQSERLASNKMFAQPQWRASTLRSISRRLQSTLSQAEASASTGPSQPPPSPVVEKLRRERRRQQGAIFIRPWDGVNSMPEAYAIIRGVERKYGKIRNFMMLRVRSYLLTRHYSDSKLPLLVISGPRQSGSVSALFLGRI